ncbi:MAG: hypothetical protein ABIL09_12990 [Gemmatimonadota bacterium]
MIVTLRQDWRNSFAVVMDHENIVAVCTIKLQDGRTDPPTFIDRTSVLVDDEVKVQMVLTSETADDVGHRWSRLDDAIPIVCVPDPDMAPLYFDARAVCTVDAGGDGAKGSFSQIRLRHAERALQTNASAEELLTAFQAALDGVQVDRHPSFLALPRNLLMPSMGPKGVE